MRKIVNSTRSLWFMFIRCFWFCLILLQYRSQSRRYSSFLKFRSLYIFVSSIFEILTESKKSPCCQYYLLHPCKWLHSQVASKNSCPCFVFEFFISPAVFSSLYFRLNWILFHFVERKTELFLIKVMSWSVCNKLQIRV